jgi:hypothetical protein
MTDRTAAALASALPPWWGEEVNAAIATDQARQLAESGWRLVHADEHSHPCTCRYRPPQTFAEHTAEALALIHDHVEASDE